MRKQITIIILSIFSICNTYCQSGFSQWRGPQRDGTYPEPNLLQSWPSGGPQLLWRYDQLGSGFSSAAVTGERVFTVGTEDSTANLFSFDLHGKLLWKKSLGPDFTGEYPGTYSTPVISGDMGYAVTSLGTLYAFSTLNGDMVWSKNLIMDFNGARTTVGFLDNLIVDGDFLYCAPGGIGKNIVALNRNSGSVIWESKGDSLVNNFCSPILIGNTGRKQYVYQDAYSILALNTSDGTVAWRYPRTSGTAVSTPLYRDGFLLTLSENGSILLKPDGDNRPQLIWTHPDFFPLQGDPVLIGNRLYGKSQGKKYYCVDWLTGRTIGAIPTRAMVVTSIAADGLIYAYDIDGAFSLLKPVDSGLETVGSFTVSSGTKYHCSHPVISGGKLFIRHDNSLFVYNITENEKSE